MARPEGIPTEFKARTWIYRAQVVLFGGLVLFCLLMGPLFLTGLMTDASDEPAPGAGGALLGAGAALVPVWALAVFNLRARRRPILRIRREGIEALQIGESSLDRFPFVPGLVRLAWSLLSGQGFRTRVVRIPWRYFRGATVSGPPMARSLLLDVKFASPVPPLVMHQVEFQQPLEDVAAAVQAYAEGRLDPAGLRGWDDQGLFLD